MVTAATVLCSTVLRNGQRMSKAKAKEEMHLRICMFLKGKVTRSGTLKNGAINEVVAKFPNISRPTVSRIWKKNKNGIMFPVSHELDVKRKKGSGRPPV